MLFNTLKEASAYLAGGRGAAGPGAGHCPGQQYAAAAGEALGALQQRARELLQRLMPQNSRFLAELLVGWLLQAALTGEALMAAEVAALAQRNPGRFQRLNQRLQVGAELCSGGLAAGCRRFWLLAARATLQAQALCICAPPTPTLCVSVRCSQPDSGAGNSSGGASNGPSGGGQRFGQQRAGGPRAGPQQPGGGWQGGSRPAGGQHYAASGSPSGPQPLQQPQQPASAASSRLLALLQAFPREQQSYLLFLEACDSHRLNSHIVRCMSAKLQAAMQQAAALPAAGLAAGTLGELMLGACTLARYLCYFSSSSALDDGSGGPAGGSSGDSSGRLGDGAALLAAAHPAGVDVGAALAAALQRGQLLLVLPWLLQYLGLAAALDKAWAERQPYAEVLLQLQQLAASPELQPSSQGFGPAALCLRLLLEECLLQAGLQPAAAAPAAAQAAAPAEQLAAHEALQLSLASPLAALVDARFMDLCCPGLEGLRRQLRASSADQEVPHGGGGGAVRQRREAPVRQVPQQQRLPQQRLPQLPRGIEAALAARQDPARLQLQQAFLAQYSTDAQLVKLRDVVNTVADVLAVNGFAAALRNVVADALPGHLQALAAAVEQVQQQEGQAGQAGQEGLAAALEQAGQACSAAASAAILQAGMAEAQRHIRRCAARAVPALLPADLPAAVAATASALAAEAAAAACAQRLVLQVGGRWPALPGMRQLCLLLLLFWRGLPRWNMDSSRAAAVRASAARGALGLAASCYPAGAPLMPCCCPAAPALQVPPVISQQVAQQLEMLRKVGPRPPPSAGAISAAEPGGGGAARQERLAAPAAPADAPGERQVHAGAEAGAGAEARTSSHQPEPEQLATQAAPAAPAAPAAATGPKPRMITAQPVAATPPPEQRPEQGRSTGAAEEQVRSERPDERGVAAAHAAAASAAVAAAWPQPCSAARAEAACSSSPGSGLPHASASPSAAAPEAAQHAEHPEAAAATEAGAAPAPAAPPAPAPAPPAPAPPAPAPAPAGAAAANPESANPEAQAAADLRASGEGAAGPEAPLPAPARCPNAAASRIAAAVAAAMGDPQLAAGLPALLSEAAGGLAAAGLGPASAGAARALLRACFGGQGSSQPAAAPAAAISIERLEELLVALLDMVAARSAAFGEDPGAAGGRGRAAAAPSYVQAPGLRAGGALQLLLRLCAALVRGYLEQSFRPGRVWLRAPGGAGERLLPLAMTKLPARVMRVANEAAELQVLTAVRTALQDATQGCMHG
jgi:hypothetical protein